jgi:hypothetical protein
VTSTAQRRVAAALGWASLAMGLCLLAPAPAARLFGLGDRTGLVRLIAARDVLVAAGLLRGRRPARWLGVQALCDALDATGVTVSLLRGRMPVGRGAAWLATAAAGAAAALLAARPR